MGYPRYQTAKYFFSPGILPLGWTMTNRKPVSNHTAVHLFNARWEDNDLQKQYACGYCGARYQGHFGSCWIIFDHPKYEVDNNYSEQHPAVTATCLFHGGKLFIFFLVVCRCACSGRSGEKLWLLSLCVCLPCCCLPCYCLPCSS